TVDHDLTSGSRTSTLGWLQRAGAGDREKGTRGKITLVGPAAHLAPGEPPGRKVDYGPEGVSDHSAGRVGDRGQVARDGDAVVGDAIELWVLTMFDSLALHALRLRHAELPR